MKVTKKTAGIAAVVGVCILTTTSLAVYNTGNGYDNLKKAILGTKDYTNCTLNVKGTFTIDGNEYTTEYLKEFDGLNKQSHALTKDSSGGYFETYYANGKGYNRSIYNENFIVYNSTVFQDNLWGVSSADEKDVNKVIKFVEAGLDTVVGDLKSNIICTDSNEEYTSYSLKLDYMQIPEIVQAGLGVIGSSSRSYDLEPTEASIDNAPYFLGEDPIVSKFEMDYTINNDGTLRNGECRIEFTGKDRNGQSHTADAVVNVEFLNVGTTVVTPVDLSNAVSLDEKYTTITE